MTNEAPLSYDQNMLDIKSVAGQEIAGNYDLKMFSDQDEGPSCRVAYWVGEQEDREAGISGGAVSPYFPTAKQAWAWCYDNETFLDGRYGDDVGGLTL